MSHSAPVTPRPGESSVRKPGLPAAPPPKPATSKRSATDDAALSELRNAGATYDYLCRKGDPVQFWEALRLARNRRAIPAPAEGEPVAPSPELEAAMLQDLESIRRHYSTLVRDLRRYLKTVPGLPEPLERFEMALAFLLISAQEHRTVTRWLAEPGFHQAKAADKLRSLAAITDPYREALEPWTLKVSPIGDEPRRAPETKVPTPPRPEPPAPARDPAPPVDSEHVRTVRRALRCCEIFAEHRLGSELWETLLLMTMDPQSAIADPAAPLPTDRESLEKLHEVVVEIHEMYLDWVSSLWATLEEKGLAPDDPRVFEVGLGLMMATPEPQERVGSWLEDPPASHEEAIGLLVPWMKRAQACLAALGAPQA